MTRLGLRIIVSLTALWLCAEVSRVDAQIANPVSGEWSKPVQGVRGRLLLIKGAPVNGTVQIHVYLELQNVSDVGSSIHLAPGQSFSFDLTDANGRSKPEAGEEVDVMTPDDPFGLVLPHESTLRFLISVTGAGIPKGKAAQISVPHESRFKSWVIDRGSASPYYLNGIFKATAQWQPHQTWSLILELPKVRVPM